MGGGRKTPQTTTVSGGIDPVFKPYLKQVLADVTDTYKASVDDPSKTVAALDPAQQAALDAQQSQAQDALTGGGAYDYTSAMNKDIQNVVGQAAGQAALGGYGGSARSQQMMASAVGDKSLQYQQQKQQDMAQGAQALGQVGSANQAYQQQLLDAPHTQASRYFGYLGSAPQQQIQKTTGGGGK